MFNDEEKVELAIGYNGGSSDDNYPHGTALTCDGSPIWYHIGVAYDGSDDSYLIHITDNAGATVGSDLTGTASNTMVVDTGSFRIGVNGANDNGIQGRIDKVELFNTKLTAAQIEARR